MMSRSRSQGTEVTIVTGAFSVIDICNYSNNILIFSKKKTNYLFILRDLSYFLEKVVLIRLLE